MKCLALIAAGAVCACAIAPLGAQPYPNKPLRLIIPFPGAGGGADFVGRVAGQKLAEGLGQPVVIENRPGAAGNIGTELVAKAQPDGYTLLVSAPSLTISPSLYKKLGYDPVKDFAPITLLAEIPNLLIVRQALPVTTVREFVDYARANPGKLNFGSSGIGTSVHLATVLFLSQTRLNLVNITYKGASQALVAMVGNEVDLVVLGPTSAMPHIQAGRVKTLAVMRSARLPSLPQVPTIKEAGVEDSEVITWYGLLAPAGTPREIVRRLNAEWVKAAALPETREKMQAAGVEILSGTPEQFAAMIRAEVPRWRKIITDANIKVE
jgi:tripartite-type tricarboxylate transporter receptor subunit TctC